MRKQSRSSAVARRFAICVTTAALCVTALIAPAVAADASTQAQLYVAVTAHGAGDCSSDDNACTLASAQTAVRALTAAPLTGDVIVNIGGGTYPVGSALTFTSADSGNNGHTVSWQAEAGAVPVLSGGTDLGGWALVSGSSTLYSANVPVGTTSRQLYVDGRRAPRASVSGDLLSGWTQTSTGYTVNKSSYLENSTASDLEFVYPGGAGATTWTANRCDVASISAGSTTDTITMVQPCYQMARLVRPNVGVPNSIENGYGLLGTPGQWYLDSAAGKVYYTPLPGETLTNQSAILATTDGLLDATGLSNVTFSGLTFAYSTWMAASGPQGVVDIQANLLAQTDTDPSSPTYGSYDTMQLPSAVDFHTCDHVRFISNTLAHLGSGGVTFDQGSSDNVIQGNLIYDTSSGAVTLGNGTYAVGTTTTYQGPDYVEDSESVTDNYVHDTGIEFPGSAAILAAWVKNTTIAHNEVFRASYTGISLGWGWGNTSDPAVQQNNHVDQNYVHDVLTTSVTDGGGIYVNGLEASSPGSSILGNYIDGDGKPYGAIYLDNGSSYFDVENNVVTDASATNAIFVTGGGWGNANTAANHNTVADNYGSTTAGGFYNASSTTTVGTNSFGLTSWPSAAISTIDSAGLEPSFAGLNPSPEVNLALRGSATASSSYSAANSPAAAIDSDSGTLWSTSSADHAAWFQLDLGASQTVEGISLLTRQDADYVTSDRQDITVTGSNNADMSSSATLCQIGATPYPFASVIPCLQGGTTAYRYLRVTKTDATGLTFAELRVFGPGSRAPQSMLSTTTMVDDTDPSITYDHVTGGGWTAQTYAGLYDNTQHYTTTNGDSLSYSFTGDGIDVVSTMATNRGSFTYAVDGGAAQSGSCYAAVSVNQATCLALTNLGPGTHTLTVTKTGGTYLTLDALRVHS